MRRLNINERLEKIKDKILEDKFIKGRGLGNEISFYIFDYDPRHELIVRDHVKMLKRIFSRPDYNRNLIEIDLYKLLITLGKKQRVFDLFFEKEKDEGKDELYKALINYAVPEIFLDEIEKTIDDHDVVLITGIGKVYPFVRSHTILNRLQEKVDKTPVILFYPGEYDGQSLNLFGTFKDDNYYRAFQLIDHKE
jgi:hypothetical protein